MNKKWLCALGFLVASIGDAAMAQDEETRFCLVEPGKGIEVFAKCKAGDILNLSRISNSITPMVCDLSKQIVVVGTQIEWCVYIGYVRKNR